jgi:hypothetical protein
MPQPRLNFVELITQTTGGMLAITVLIGGMDNRKSPCK